jgi:hypothetical protein
MLPTQRTGSFGMFPTSSGDLPKKHLLTAWPLYWGRGMFSVRWEPRNIKTPWPESASELYLPSDRRLSAKLVPTFADRRCRVVSATDPYGRIVGFLDQEMGTQLLIII